MSPRWGIDTKTDWRIVSHNVTLALIESWLVWRGVEYLYRDPASSRRLRKGKSQTWVSKIWSRVLKDSDPRKTALARVSTIYKRQTRPLVREGVPWKQDPNCRRLINICSWAPDGAPHQDLLTDWASLAMWLWLWLWTESSVENTRTEEYRKSVGVSVKRMGIQWYTRSIQH
jgi:hypothetical protein